MKKSYNAAARLTHALVQVQKHTGKHDPVLMLPLSPLLFPVLPMDGVSTISGTESGISECMFLNMG